MPQYQNEFFGDNPSALTVKERLMKYFANWPLILACVLLCVGAAIVYIEFAMPKYLATTTFLIKGEEEGKPNSQDLIERSVNGGKKEINLNNEMLLINSSGLMERTVAKNGFNVSYFKKGSLKNIDISQNAPFTLVARRLTDSTHSYTINIKRIGLVGGNFLYGNEKEEKSVQFRWNEPFMISGQQFVLMPSGKQKIEFQEVDYLVLWQPVNEAASKYSEALVVKAYDTKASVIELSIKTESLDRGVDLLNALFDEFNSSDMDDRKKLSEITIQFIDERLMSISKELQGVEGNLENYRGSNELIDMNDQSRQSLEYSGAVSKTLKELAIQQSLVNMILNYFKNPSNGSKLVPSSLGLNDGTLASLIVQYNELQLKKEREVSRVAPNSTVMLDLNTQLESLKSSILESLNNISRNLQLQEKNFNQQNSQNKSYLASIPHDERVLQEIKRKQNITEGLYLYLLQKREEAAISGTASDVTHYKQIDLASGIGPVEPNSVNIIVYAALFGLFLSFGWIYTRQLFNDKVNSKQEVVKRTSLPVIGQINHISKRDHHLLYVWGNNAIGEQFRAVRTSLYSLLRDNSKKVILITSSTHGEGKSFISLNLAAVCAVPGKKVALLEFDIRKPSIAAKLNLVNTRGLAQYLTGEVNSISEISYAINKIPSLHVFPSGPVPSNPADLLSTGRLSRLFETLKANYDYIIIDSPPSGMVSDSFIMGEYSDLVLYIVRSQKTLKRQLDFIRETINNNSFKKVALILNDIKKGDNYGFEYESHYNPEHSNGKLLV
jgi:capsular exopolysaccharide synthesis family protein